MRLRVAFQVAIGPLRPTGEAVIDLHMRADKGRIYFDIAQIDFPDSRLYRWLDALLDLSKPLTQQLNDAVNQAIADVPKHNPHVQKLEILDLTM